jgi:hypothetical protein
MLGGGEKPLHIREPIILGKFFGIKAPLAKRHKPQAPQVRHLDLDVAIQIVGPEATARVGAKNDDKAGSMIRGALRACCSLLVV